YRGDPRYVAPLRREVHALLDPARNPWHRHAELALFVAVRGRETVGRIAAIRDRRYDQIRAEPLGFFGFFDCVDDGGCAASLLARIAGAVEARGEFRIRTIDPRRFASEVEIVRALYNTAWEVNWGFVPLAVDEMEWRAAQLRRLLDPRVALVVEAQRAAGFEP